MEPNLITKRIVCFKIVSLWPMILMVHNQTGMKLEKFPRWIQKFWKQQVHLGKSAETVYTE